MTPARRPVTGARETWTSVRDAARGHLRDAETKLVLLLDGENAKGIAADAVLAAIAYGDALTVQRLGQRNVQDHGALPDLVKRALGKSAAREQITRLARIIGEKSRAQYGGAFWTRQQGEDYLKQVQRFAAWAEQVLAESA